MSQNLASQNLQIPHLALRVSHYGSHASSHAKAHPHAYFLRRPLLLLLLLSLTPLHLALLHAAQTQSSLPQWSWERELWLEKEQLYKASFDLRGVSKELILRWTLYKNKGLVLHIQYDKFNHQEVLYTDYQRNAFKITLGREEAAQKSEPKLLLYFKDFKDGKAFLKLYIEGNGATLLHEEVGESPSKLKKERAQALDAFIRGGSSSQSGANNSNTNTQIQNPNNPNPSK